MNRFENKFGSPDKVIIGFGDFEQRKHMKFKEPIKGKGMRSLFKKYGYKTYLVDEFRRRGSEHALIVYYYPWFICASWLGARDLPLEIMVIGLVIGRYSDWWFI